MPENFELRRAPGVLTLICRKCTRLYRKSAADHATATRDAARIGWKFDRNGGNVCPRCL